MNAGQRVIIVGICGSLSADSSTERALACALEGAAEADAETIEVDLKKLPLPFCDAREDERTYPPEVFRLREIVKSADGIILATPEYHNSFSGVLKNALDLLSSEEFDGKMVGLIGVAGGATGAVNAINHLRTVLRAVGAWVVPHQVSIASAHRAFDANGKLVDEKLDARLKKLGADVAKYARVHGAAF